MAQEIELFELIGQVRRDLEAARTEGEGRGIRFKLEEVELELKMVAKRGSKGEGGLKLYVLNVQAGREASHEAAQTIRIKMTPERDEPDEAGNLTARIAQPAGGKLPG